MTDKEMKKRYHSDGLVFQVTTEEIKEHFSKRIADIGNLIKKGTEGAVVIPDIPLNGLKRKLEFFKFAYAHIPEGYVFDVHKVEVDNYDLAGIEPIEALYQAKIL